ncbi:MAG: SH3 type 3 domain-containing protein, poly-gamma-glutamate synthesis protein (capsule biosynthesis protein) [Candidatus Peregrinibacteria bacterium GW2011_GWC2_39_14]|nr:MAG: Capsule synthesis protein, CapA [Candidatus Peregrinibacteria bacterium GW2011_GWA2_38_36]KKR06593.1 MAG: SH3 type 3 domain-containing protein, poly-gamma-glutamate synthesis protein (capsule biosynthesis protein) [Candidatus Peregrinibacteria bacterium GW2011_GWC2_39_14]
MYKKFIAVTLITIAVVIGAGVITYKYPKVREKITLQGVLKDEFKEFKEARELASNPEKVSMIAVGDIMLSRVVDQKMRTNKNYEYPFLRTAEYLKSADFAFGNLETAITPGRPVVTGEMSFRADPENASVLKKMNFEIISLANNHTPNFGQKGLKDTFESLDKAGVKFAGAGLNKTAAAAPVYIEKNGFKFAFLAYNDLDVVPKSYFAWDTNAGTNPMYEDEMIKAVKDAKNNADFVIVSMHSGIEYVPHPSTRQVNFAHAAIDAGAEIVIGHHPHVIQDVEKYKGKYILYSLGNFVFDQMWSRETREGLTAKIDFTKAGVASINFEPILIEDYSQPRLFSAADKENLLNSTRFVKTNADSVFINQEGYHYYDTKKTNIFSTVLAINEKTHKDFDLDKDGVKETYDLKDGRLTVSENSQQIWQSSEVWFVDSFEIADSTGDSIPDLNMSVWKSGNFGPSKPFWVTKNDPSVRNHFFVFDYKGKKISAVWQSSNLSKPNCAFEFQTVPNEKFPVLVTYEGDYSDLPNCTPKTLGIWKWNEWGFMNEMDGAIEP